MQRIIAIFALVAAVMLTGCEVKTTQEEPIIFKTLYKQNGMEIICDTESGVHYIVYKSGYKGGITPRLDADGNVVVQYRITESGKPR